MQLRVGYKHPSRLRGSTSKGDIGKALNKKHNSITRPPQLSSTSKPSIKWCTEKFSLTKYRNFRVGCFYGGATGDFIILSSILHASTTAHYSEYRGNAHACYGTWMCILWHTNSVVCLFYFFIICFENTVVHFLVLYNACSDNFERFNS